MTSVSGAADGRHQAMIQILARLNVKDFVALETFERQALAIMNEYGGRFVVSFEVARFQDGTGSEIHVLQFPSAAQFEQYRADSRLLAMAELRARAIESTEVCVSSQIKDYSRSAGAGGGVR
ncbi:MAG: DUF1330 domain-containing protein [Burkholderiaceae bacterium]